MKMVTQKFKNLSRRNKIIVITCSMLVLLLVISIPTAMVLSSSSDSKEIKTSTKKTSNLKSKTKKDESNKEESENDDKEATEESAKESEITAEEKSEEQKQSESSNNNQTANSGASTSGTVSQATSQSAPQQSQPVQQQTPQATTPAPQPQTAWEKLGISEYAYYNTTLEGVQPDFRGSDLSVCNAEVSRIGNTYYRQGVNGGNSFTVTGKYTGQYLGCGLKIVINGVEYSYSQAKGILGF